MKSSLFYKLLSWLLLCLLPNVAHALCVCGYSDGRFTTDQAMSLDGNMHDWTAVLADTDNNVCDGGLDNAGVLYEPQPDLDAPIQSTGRDLLHFAYTWDDNRVYTYTARAASQSNTQTFIYYADTNNNGLMETGERVILVAWQGNNGSVKVYYGTYSENAIGGDPMVDSSGKADGYTLPGTILNVTQQSEGNWGGNDGLSMEWSAKWADLGIPSRTAFSFHVSSTNASPNAGSLPGQIDDNMGGCGGGPVSTQYADLTFTPDRILMASPGTTVYAAHELTNAGNGTDTFAFSSSTTGASDYAPEVITYYRDLGSVGQYDAGTDTPLTDTDSDGIVDSDALNADAAINILVAYDIPAGADGIAEVVTTATSTYDPNIGAMVTDEIRAIRPNLTVVKSATRSGSEITTAAPGQVITYTVTVHNFGSAEAANVVIDDHMSPYTAFRLESFQFTDDSTSPSGLALGVPVYSSDGGENYNYTPDDPDGDGYDGDITNWKIEMENNMAAGGKFTLTYQVKVK